MIGGSQKREWERLEAGIFVMVEKCYKDYENSSTYFACINLQVYQKLRWYRGVVVKHADS